VTLRGGAGNDLYRVDADSLPNIVEHAGEGRDTVQVQAGATYTLGSNLENLMVFGSGAAPTELTGNELGNLISAGTGVDFIDGGGGHDRLYGLEGDDTVYGGAGADWIDGGGGYDQLTGGAGRDTFVYTDVSDAPYPTGYGVEFINDLDSLDIINLSGIDANETIAGNQSFEFEDYYSGIPPADIDAGTLIAVQGSWGELYLIGHTDDDGEADFVIGVLSWPAPIVDHLVL
jgi:hypothetical protein